ncbi:XRE family transcriptional regulator [Streptomyces sp. LP05-1]|uniref:XRE family transcriptional regulator n=1 Tax=Streptomyces pyxinae TaxID=2970734 RepID=A0ABT2CBE6_9ACTN|nr:XRE family transcriptional regulator [Streptomyces sp. LP05-1]MCS0634732.1 XRE family transcriptional regulator [Streptomyces sp. LP05-1]
MSEVTDVAAECSRLAAALRELRQSTGLSLAALAARTPYSKSSWERYLNGKKPVPRRAVESLCAMAGESPGRLLVLWELADAAWSGRSAPPGPAPGTPTAPGSGPPAAWHPARAGPVPRRPHRWAAGAAAGAVVLLGLGGLVMAPRGAGSPAGAGEPAIRNPGCTGMTCEGKDPRTMGCGGAGMVSTVAERTGRAGQRLELRQGEDCRAVWARATALKPGDRVEMRMPDGRTQYLAATGRQGVETYIVTPMAAADGPGAQRARVCLMPEHGEAECFGPPAPGPAGPGREPR